MSPELKQIEKQIKKTHKFGFTPKYSSEFFTQISPLAFIAISQKVFEKLGWEIIYFDENTIEAHRQSKNLGISTYTNAIVATFSQGKITVKSESLGSEIWDNGKNSKTVQLFIHVFKEFEKSYNYDEIKDLENEQESKNNWDDYVIPTVLPQPYPLRTPKLIYPILFGIIASILLAILVATLSIENFYILFLVEFLSGLTIAFSLKLGMKYGNYTDFLPLRNILIGCVILFFIANQFFQYTFLNFDQNFGFLDFLKMRFDAGLTYKTSNLGSIGLTLFWIVQIGLTFVFGYLNLVRFLISFIIKRVPTEVVDFAYYHFLKGKNEIQVREELTNMGWSKIQHQDEVFEALDGIEGNNQLIRSS